MNRTVDRSCPVPTSASATGRKPDHCQAQHRVDKRSTPRRLERRRGLALRQRGTTPPERAPRPNSSGRLPRPRPGRRRPEAMPLRRRSPATNAAMNPFPPSNPGEREGCRPRAASAASRRPPGSDPDCVVIPARFSHASGPGSDGEGRPGSPDQQLEQGVGSARRSSSPRWPAATARVNV